jgi:hypothetical protein
MAEAYRTLATAHRGHPKISALWAKTALEEDGHVSHFDLAMSVRGDMIQSSNINLVRIDEAVKGVKDFLEEIKTSPPDIRTALRTAIQLEEQYVQFHMDMAVAFDTESHRKLFRAMMAADKEHVDSLCKALRELEGPKA